MERVRRLQGETGQRADGLRQGEQPLEQGGQNQRSLKVLQGLLQNQTELLLLGNLPIRIPFQPGQSQYFRIIGFNADRIECQLSCKPSDLTPNQVQTCDRYFDRDRFEGEKAADEKARKGMQQKKSLNSRVTLHPLFHNLNWGKAEKMLRKIGEV
jgi:hypothetical protein